MSNTTARVRWLLLALPLGTVLLWAGCAAADEVEAAGPETAGAEFVADLAGLRPPSTRAEDVVDVYHGAQVADPYRWLEDQDGAEVSVWVDQQNGWTESWLARMPERDAIRERLTELWRFERWSAPERHGEHWVWSRNDGVQNQAVLYRGANPGGVGVVLFDPNELSADGTVALGGVAFSKDGTHMAYALSQSGSDWRTWHVLEVATGRKLDDRLEWSKFSSASWTADGKGFFYQRYPAPAEGEVFEAQNTNPQLCYHALGTAQSEDRVVYERPDEPKWSFAARVADAGDYVWLSIGEGTDRRKRLAYIDLADEAMAVKPLLMEFDASYSVIGSEGGTAWILTDKDAPNRRLIAVDVTLPQPANWAVLIPERTEKLERVKVIGDQFVATYLEDAKHAVERFALDGDSLGALPLPGIATVGGFTGERGDPTTHFTVTTFTRPASVYSFDFESGTTRLVREPELGWNPEDYRVRQVGFSSVDGTPSKMFVMHQQGLPLSGDNPALLYGYGGFNISLTPRFSVENLVWCELGGVFAQATLRGGGEYGEEWHAGGMLQNKQNVFDDFYAAGQWLARNDFTSPELLGITGGSNGGLLVGACLTQHPEVYGAAIPQVGVLDMLRYHKFTIGWAWVSDYGSAEDPEMFEVLRRYSPLHNVRAGASYPPTMITTGDHDDRVLPGHSYKFAAALQAAQTGSAPVLLRVTRKAGHGAGKPTALRIAEATDRLAFLRWALASE